MSLNGALNEVEKHIRKAIQLQPDYAGARGNLGSLLEGKAKLGLAEKQLRHALKIDPANSKINYNMANVMRK